MKLCMKVSWWNGRIIAIEDIVVQVVEFLKSFTLSNKLKNLFVCRNEIKQEDMDVD